MPNSWWEKKSEEDEQTLEESNSAHRRSQPKWQLVQTSCLKRVKLLLFLPYNKHLGLPRCKNLWSFSLFCSYCLGLGLLCWLLCFLCFTSLVRVTVFLHRGWAKHLINRAKSVCMGESWPRSCVQTSLRSVCTYDLGQDSPIQTSCSVNKS